MGEVGNRELDFAMLVLQRSQHWESSGEVQIKGDMGLLGRVWGSNMVNKRGAGKVCQDFRGGEKRDFKLQRERE